MSQKCLFLVIFETNFNSFLLIFPKIIAKNDSLNSYTQIILVKNMLNLHFGNIFKLKSIGYSVTKDALRHFCYKT